MTPLLTRSVKGELSFPQLPNPPQTFFYIFGTGEAQTSTNEAQTNDTTLDPIGESGGLPFS